MMTGVLNEGNALLHSCKRRRRIKKQESQKDNRRMWCE
jgi:hypothetical protein